MAGGASVFRPVRFIGRIEQLCFSENIPFRLIKRTEVKGFVCPKMRAKDSHVRAAMIRLYGAPGTKRAPGRTFGIANDVWSALAIAHTYSLTRLPQDIL